jgi:hypothetical protein
MVRPAVSSQTFRRAAEARDATARRGRGLLAHAAGGLVAVAAGVHHGVLLSAPLNDNFMHMTLARQLLGGDVPVRDFFESGVGLQYVLSAAAEWMVGYRLLSEALVVGVMAALSTYLVFAVVRKSTASTLAAALAALLVLLAAPRGYSYPKLIVYATAAALWWSYVSTPTLTRAALFGAWAAAAFYWRPDHGLYVAVGVLFAAVAAHGPGLRAVRDAAVAGATALAATIPFFVFVHATVGLPEYVQAGAAQARFEHTASANHEWPRWPIRRLSDVAVVEPADTYAPVVALRWADGSAPEARQALLARYRLTPIRSEGPQVQQVRMSAEAVDAVRALVNEPIVEDTAGIDRSAARLPWTTWGPVERWRFRYPWLRVRIFPAIDERTRASEAVAVIFHSVPLLVLAMAALTGRARTSAPPWLTPRRLALFAAFCIVVNVGLMRTPYDVRAVDAVVLPSILLGWALTALWRSAAGERRTWRLTVAAAALVSVVLVVKSVAVAGEFGGRVGWLAGDWTSLARARGAWADVYARLAASPPLSYWDDRSPRPVPIALAAYARACVPESDRLLVLWFAPEIYYYADRLMAARHAVYVSGWNALPAEQQATEMKIRKFAPPLAFATRSALDGYARATFPRAAAYVDDAYAVAGALAADGEEYLVLARRGRPVLGTYGEQAWPCYRPHPSAADGTGPSA